MDKRQLKKLGLKITAPRMKILQILANKDKHHLSAEEVYKLLLEINEDIGLATVYRVLTQFAEVGLVTKHNFEGGFSVFELNKGQHHDHLVCIKCGKVAEFVDDIIEQRQQFITTQAHFTMTYHCLNIYGLCDKCQ